MNAMEEEAPKKNEGFGGVTAAYILMPEHIDWLKRKRKETGRSASLILRELIKAAMNGEDTSGQALPNA